MHLVIYERVSELKEAPGGERASADTAHTHTFGLLCLWGLYSVSIYTA